MKKFLNKIGLVTFEDYIQVIGGIVAVTLIASVVYTLFDIIWSDHYDFLSLKISLSILVVFGITQIIEGVNKKLKL